MSAKGLPIIKVCGHCSDEFDARAKNHNQSLKRMNSMQYCSRGCMARDRAKTINQENHPLWKGGVYGDNGYKRINAYKNGKPMQHDKIMEEYLGRTLLPNEVVHHIDRDRSNNNLDNLQLMTRSEHSKLHYIKGHYSIGSNKYVTQV